MTIFTFCARTSRLGHDLTGTPQRGPSSGEVLYKGREVRLRHNPARQARAARPKPSRGDSPAPADLSSADAAVFEKLRAWRAAAAKEQGVPAYVIFHDATLRQIAALPPSTLTQLAAVSGVGEAKLARYGQQILDVLGG
jgi:ATP-dependent DNA helicase RecQ